MSSSIKSRTFCYMESVTILAIVMYTHNYVQDSIENCINLELMGCFSHKKIKLTYTVKLIKFLYTLQL